MRCAGAGIPYHARLCLMIGIAVLLATTNFVIVFVNHPQSRFRYRSIICIRISPKEMLKLQTSDRNTPRNFVRDLNMAGGDGRRGGRCTPTYSTAFHVSSASTCLPFAAPPSTIDRCTPFRRGGHTHAVVNSHREREHTHKEIWRNIYCQRAETMEARAGYNTCGLVHGHNRQYPMLVDLSRPKPTPSKTYSCSKHTSSSSQNRLSSKTKKSIGQLNRRIARIRDVSAKRESN